MEALWRPTIVCLLALRDISTPGGRAGSRIIIKAAGTASLWRAWMAWFGLIQAKPSQALQMDQKRQKTATNNKKLIKNTIIFTHGHFWVWNLGLGIFRGQIRPYRAVLLQNELGFIETR